MREREREREREIEIERERERERLRLRLRGTAKTRNLRVGRKEQSVEMNNFSTSSREPTDNKEQREERNIR